MVKLILAIGLGYVLGQILSEFVGMTERPE